MLQTCKVHGIQKSKFISATGVLVANSAEGREIQRPNGTDVSAESHCPPGIDFIFNSCG
jgi:hypothetical protein